MKKKPRTTKKQRKFQRGNIDAMERLQTMAPRDAAEFLRASQEEMSLEPQELRNFVRIMEASGFLPAGTSQELPFTESQQDPALLPSSEIEWEDVISGQMSSKET